MWGILNKYIPVVKRAVPESWGTSNGTFTTKKVGDIKLSFINYSISKREPMWLSG